MDGCFLPRSVSLPIFRLILLACIAIHCISIPLSAANAADSTPSREDDPAGEYGDGVLSNETGGLHRRSFTIFDMYDVDGDGFIGADEGDMAALPLNGAPKAKKSGKGNEREFRERAERILQKIPVLKQAVDFAGKPMEREGFSFGIVGTEKQNGDIFKREFEGRSTTRGMGKHSSEIDGTIAPRPEVGQGKSLGVSYGLSW